MFGALIAASLMLHAADSAPPSATAPMRCGPVAVVLNVLAMRWHEVPVWGGVIAPGRAMTLTASPKGTWTLMVMEPGPAGPMACLLGDGDHATPVSK